MDGLRLVWIGAVIVAACFALDHQILLLAWAVR
jgi:hypothetical protein